MWLGTRATNARHIHHLCVRPTKRGSAALRPQFRHPGHLTSVALSAAPLPNLHHAVVPVSAREMIAYVGLVPRERSSGERQRRGSSTKAGNSDVCHVLVHAAWTYWFAPKARSSNICSALHVHGARMPDAASAARGVYTPRRLQASPLFRLVSDLLHGLRRALCAGVRPAPNRRPGGGQVRGLRDPRARGGARRSRRRRGQTPSPRTSARDILPTPRLKFPSRPDSCVTLSRRGCGPHGRLARRTVATH